MRPSWLLPIIFLFAACQPQPEFDVLIKNGMLLDGSGGDAIRADLGIRGDSIAAIGDLSTSTGKSEMDVAGKYVAPGFINMLSWANESLLIDGRSQSDLRQGVTLEVMGEGHSMGPLNPEMKAEMIAGQTDYQFEIPHQYATGIQHVLVNGVPVIQNGNHTGATPGRFIKGPGYKQ